MKIGSAGYRALFLKGSYGFSRNHVVKKWATDVPMNYGRD